jgi:tetratricopeptide (TPR) repeat protein
LLSVVGICGLLGLAIHLAPRHRIASFCLLWLFLHLVIESSIIPLEMVFEHRLYLPMFGASLLVAWLLYELAGVRSRWSIGMAAAICLFLALGTYQRNRVWQNELTLWEDAVAKSPLYERPHNNLGIALQLVGRTEEAIAHYQEALRINPDYVRAHYNCALALAGLGRFEEAVTHHQEALRIQPDFAGAHNNLAWLLATCPDAAVRDGRRALAHAMRAIQLAGDDDVMILDTLAAAHAELGDFDEAVRWQERAVRMASGRTKDVLAARLGLYKQGQPYRGSN